MHTLNHLTPVCRRKLGFSVIAAALLAVIAMPAAALSDTDTDTDIDNHIELFNQGDDNQVLLQQRGELNNINLLVQANNVAANIFQQGSSNLVAGVNGAPALTMSGHHSQLDIIQNGIGNQVFAMQMSANSSINVTQLGQGNTATIIQR
ncbi:MAG: hypothetical protein JJU03_12730 [Idiomarina sp.]|nr:hypothetical protein [Idiomarina sp.]